MKKTSSYDKLVERLRTVIPRERLIRDELRLFACGTDASFYRLIPKLIVQVSSEHEVAFVMRACSHLDIPFTFRGAGTSLSGQAVSDSVLIQIHRLWNKVEVSQDGTEIRCAPGALGGDANRALAPFGRKIGPDPASIDSAMIAGIAANNASGMCCGNVQDTYHTMASARIVFANGTVLDTGSEESRNRFVVEQQALVAEIDTLTKHVKGDEALTERIRRKYRIKNTTGYSLHALIDFDDSVDIIQHLLIGSEGTLAFLSEITYETIADHSFRATALILFPHIHAACEASHLLSKTQVLAVELMDRHSLRSIEAKPGIPERIQALPQDACALLVEVRAETEGHLDGQVDEVEKVLNQCTLLELPAFTRDKAEVKRLWEIRKGLFPSLGYSRQDGTTIIIEDVAFPLEALAEAALDLRKLFERYGYVDAVIFGHALQGNLHFVFCVDFQVEAEVRKYAAFLNGLVRMVTEKYGGSLKAEHGTGRNMAPFVESEWGREAMAVMREIKRIFDPKNLLNPGVILSDDPQTHISNLKQTPPSHPIIEKCTECGFCERTCPSRYLTLTPRQRIAAWREISRLQVTREDSKRLRQLRQQFNYAGDQTCAVDGLCAWLCPLGINTGFLIKELRHAGHSAVTVFIADVAAKEFGNVLSLARGLLRIGEASRSILGEKITHRVSKAIRYVTRNSIPEWSAWTPKPAPLRKRDLPCQDSAEKVIYFPSCVSRLFGSSAQSPYSQSQRETLERVLKRARFTHIYPARLDDLCCGMAFSSKGFPRQAEVKLRELFELLWSATENGRYPVLVDTSPCAQRLKQSPARHSELRIYDVAAFLRRMVVPRVHLQKVSNAIAIHVPCSLQNTSEEEELLTLAKVCAENVYVPATVPCCGFAGDRGFTHPELAASALITLKGALPVNCTQGYSTSRTCEIGLSQHSGISYQSITYLVDDAIELVE